MAKQPVYQFYSELRGCEPKIWRRFQVVGTVTLARLSYFVMTMYEMRGQHLFAMECPVTHNQEFLAPFASSFPKETDGRMEISFELKCAVIPDECKHDYALDAKKMKLSMLANKPGLTLNLVYDFGDEWVVELSLEEVIEDAPKNRLMPYVLEGEGYGIIENCGGVDQLMHIGEVIKDRTHKEFKEISSWLGTDEFDLGAFDIKDMTYRLQLVPPLFKKVYESGVSLYPDDLDYLNRS